MGIPATLSTVPAQTPYIQYVATSGQTVFPYPFEITQDSDLIVVASGVTLATDSGYTLSGVGNATGGNLTFTSGRTAGDIITLYRDIPIERLTQFAQNGGFSSTAFNAEFNNVYLLLQQLQQNLDQCLQIPNTNNPAPTVSLTPSAYANKYLAFDANGNPEPALLSSSGTLTGSLLAQILSVYTAAAVLPPFKQTSAEAAASVIPTNYAYPPGDFRRYGISVGTGGDDTAAINTAVSVVQECVVAQGVTLLSTGAHAPVSGCVVRGPGTIKLSGGTNALFAVTASTVRFVDLQVDCSANTSPGKTAVSIGGTATDVEVSDCVLTQARILTTGTNSNIRIRRNRCSGSCVGGISGATINIASSGTTSEFSVTDNRVETSDGAGIGVFNLADHGLISGNVCSSNTGSGILLQSGQHMVVSNNLCESNSQVGIGFQPPAATAASQRTALIGNICRANSFDGFDINVDSTAPNYVYLEVVGNHAESNGTVANGGTGFYLKYASLCTVVGNSAFGNVLDGILCQGGTLLTVQGNVCTANGAGTPGTNNGITLNGISNSTVTGNVCTNTSGGNNQAYGIAEIGSSNGNVITGNNCPNNVTGGVSTVGALTVAKPNIGGRIDQSFTVSISNSAGTLQHAIYAQPGAASIGNLVSKVSGATSSPTSTPTGSDSTTAFAGGGKIGSANTNYFWLNTADQLSVATADLSGPISFNSTGAALTAEVVFASIDINGVTAFRPALAFFNATTGAAVALNTTNIPAGDTLQVQLRGSLL